MQTVSQVLSAIRKILSITNDPDFDDDFILERANDAMVTAIVPIMTQLRQDLLTINVYLPANDSTVAHGHEYTLPPYGVGAIETVTFRTSTGREWNLEEWTRKRLLDNYPNALVQGENEGEPERFWLEGSRLCVHPRPTEGTLVLSAPSRPPQLVVEDLHFVTGFQDFTTFYEYPLSGALPPGLGTGESVAFMSGTAPYNVLEYVTGTFSGGTFRPVPGDYRVRVGDMAAINGVVGFVPLSDELTTALVRYTASDIASIMRDTELENLNLGRYKMAVDAHNAVYQDRTPSASRTYVNRVMAPSLGLGRRRRF